MQTASNVAKWFLSRNELRFAEGDTEYISNLKLQKLLYYAQGLFLAVYGSALFNDPIVAWEHGPVVRDVYDEYKANRSAGIKNFEPPNENFKKAEEDILTFVQYNFGQYSAWRLRDMTHEELPWKTTRQNDEIKADKIKDYFLENYIQKDGSR